MSAKSKHKKTKTVTSVERLAGPRPRTQVLGKLGLLPKTAGEFIREHRIRIKWTLRNLAEALKCIPADIDRIESNRRLISDDPRTLDAITSALKLSIDEKDILNFLISITKKEKTVILDNCDLTKLAEAPFFSSADLPAWEKYVRKYLEKEKKICKTKWKY